MLSAISLVGILCEPLSTILRLEIFELYIGTILSQIFRESSVDTGLRNNKLFLG